MKTMSSCAALAAMLVATSCSQQEISEVTPGPAGNGEPVALSISTGVLRTETKAVVEGEYLTYTKANYATEAKGLGLLVLNADGSARYANEANNDGASSDDHIWFMGDEKGENWKSISDQGANFAAATAASYFLSDKKGMVYAYYPKATTVTGTTKDALTIPAPLQTAGAITLGSGVCSDVKWNGSKWMASTSTERGKIAPAFSGEVDYLYASNEEAARYVNNGQAAGSNPEDNPGKSIDLTLSHALSMVSFRVYNDGTLGKDEATKGKLTKIVIRNVATMTAFHTTSAATMNLATGAIAGLTANTADALTRTLTDYKVVRAIKDTETEDADHFIEAAPTVTGPKAARKVAMLVYPIAELPADEIELVFTIDGEDYPVVLPVTDAPAWAAGYNYLYTIKASARALEVTSVVVTPWENTDGGNIDL